MVWALSPSKILTRLWRVEYCRFRAPKSEKCNKTLISVQVYGFWYIFLFCLIKSATIGCPKDCVAKNSDQLPVLNRLTDTFAVGKFDYDVMMRYQNLTWKPELFRAPWARAPLGRARLRCTPWTPLSQALPAPETLLSLLFGPWLRKGCQPLI